MSQPVVDTLELCDAFRKTGMEPEQAEGMARALGEELGAHVVAQGDLRAGFLEMRGEIEGVDRRVDLVRIELGGQIRALDGKIDRVKTELGGRIEALDGKIDRVKTELDSKIDSVKTELGGRIDVVGAKLDALNNSLKIVAAAIGLTIAIVGFVAGTAVLRSPAPAQWYAPPQATVPAAPASAETARTSMP